MKDTRDFTPLAISQSSDLTLLSGRSGAMWGGLKTDDYKAYVQFKINHSLPWVHGPETHGRYYGFHPQVLANSAHSLLHQQMNLGHRLKVYRARRDYIVGTVVGVAFPEAPEGDRWELPECQEAAPCMTVVAVLHKLAEGVPDFIGAHLSGRKPSAVSIETGAANDSLFIYDPGPRSLVSLQEAMAGELAEALRVDKRKGLQIGQYEGRQLALAPGGEDGAIGFRGVGYVPNGAEAPARITNFRAEQEDGSTLLCATAQLEWEAGMEVEWSPIMGRDAGRGTVVELIEVGEHEIPGRGKVVADSVNPLLQVKVTGRKYSVLRTAAGVRKVRIQ